MSKGFYFSFDALIALTVMAGSLLLVHTSTGIVNDPFETSLIKYKEADVAGQDAMKLSSRQDYRVFNSSFRNELVSETVMEDEDLDRTVADGLTLLWAARNFSYAEKVAKSYFDRKVPDSYDYRVQVNEGGSTTYIYNSSEMPQDVKAASTASRLVSGHQIDRPSEGYQARARAESVIKNSTRIVSIPAMGNANTNGKFEARREFNLSEPEKIYNATFYINVEYNGDSRMEQFTINGHQKKNDVTYIHDNGDTFYGVVDVTEEVEAGENSLYVRVKGDASQSEPTEFQPGTKLEIKYRKKQVRPVPSETRHERVYFENLTAETPGGESGIFKVESFELPRDATLVNASMRLKALNLDSDCGYYSFWYPSYDWDVKVIFNGNVLEESCQSGVFDKEYVLDSYVKKGTNTVAVYLENYGDTFWGGDRLDLYSSFDEKGSHIDVWYNVSQDDLRFGEIKVSQAEKMGGGTENTKIYDKEFKYGELASSRVYIAQKYSNTVHLEVDDGSGYNTVFESPGVRATPTRLTVDPSYYDEDKQNRIKLWDEYNNKYDPDIVEFYPESTFQWTVWAPSQVGYGSLFDNRSAAVDDAEKRLKKEMGPFVDATGIDTGSVSTDDQPYLWGPASLKLVVWDG